MEPIASAFNRT